MKKLNSLCFKVNDTNFQIIEAKSTGRGPMDCEYTILNLDNGNRSVINLEKLLKYIT